MKPRYASIVIDVHHQKVDRIFTYLVPESLQEVLCPGQLVRVPFGAHDQLKRGYILELCESLRPEEEKTIGDKIDKLKSIHSVLQEEPLLREREIRLAKSIAERYMSPLSASLALFLPKLPSRTKSSLSKAAGKLREGTEEKSQIKSEEEAPASFECEQKDLWPLLNEQQLSAVQKITDSLEKKEFREYLLFGITGSGKTEVYMRVIREAFTRGRRTILLVPEISLTPQLIEVFRERFGEAVGFTHSRMTDKERTVVWHEAAEGKYQVMIGPRSALFMPMKDLGLVILDEEHESSYRSDQLSPHYHAREVAEMMCRLDGCPLVLGSATPDLSTYYRAQNGEIALLELPKRAVRSSHLPSSRLVDMRLEMQNGNMGIFCSELTEKIRQRLERKEQTILFLNRKGYATFVNCRSCGFVLKCPRCYMPYTYHKESDRLICHHCGKEVRLPSICPSCGSIHIRSFGVGTERVEEEAARLFPGASICRMDMGTMKKREDYEEVYQKFRQGEGDILIGTQMVAKGFDFPKVTLVGVLAADMTLYNADFHSSERTFQLLTQVAGRAGRGDLPGEVLIQTFSPEHYCLVKASEQDYPGFYKNEIAARRLMQCPPFTHLGQVIIQSRREDNVTSAAKQMAELMRNYAKGKSIEILGPSPAQLFRINNVFRWKLLIKCAEEDRLRNFVRYTIDRFKERSDLARYVVIMADIDPMTIQ
ncbi:MAG: primosomal protein N' [Firmicutes bacterium]|nr:primosomal protein N' [Bacillota bacterium]